jgi:hypothetical protein
MEKYSYRVKAHRVPDSHADTLLGRAWRRLSFAEENMREWRIEDSELEIRMAAEEGRDDSFTPERLSGNLPSQGISPQNSEVSAGFPFQIPRNQ